MSTMTLEQVRATLDEWGNVPMSDVHMPALYLRRMRDAIDACIAQPGKAVDVGTIRKARTLIDHVVHGEIDQQQGLGEAHDLLTRALSGETAGPAGCCCGDSRASGVRHRSDGPCYKDSTGADYRPSPLRHFRHPHCGLTLTRDGAPDKNWHWSVTMPDGHLYDISRGPLTFEQALADMMGRGVAALDAADMIWRRTRQPHPPTPDKEG